MKRVCSSCGRTIRNESQLGRQVMGKYFCTGCTDEYGQLKKKTDITEVFAQRLMKQMGISKIEAMAIAEQNVNQFPFWIKKECKMKNTNRVIITDVGSTTTKAIYLKKENEKWRFVDYETASTTVEKPTEDVTIGVTNAIQKLEKVVGESLLRKTENDLVNFEEDILYLTTSSAGGGLQVLVVGLTMFDSAATGNRTAYGAGGVILDTFAIDDKRSALEQMRSMKVLHPDIILMSGGVDGGAISPILRLGEILSLANPKAKFGTHNVPLVFAGNNEMENLITSLFNDKFDLHVVPNIRPTMMEENMQPARDKIHQLFLENVMEQAPGYAKLKKSVNDEIIPTPLGVINSLRLISNESEERTIAVDIGGATTDVFSFLHGDYFRTVSANYGMSYSVSNVMAEATIENIMQWLPVEADESLVRDYIGNKMLYPQQVPATDFERSIEHAVAREAIRMAKNQHMEMNFNRENLGFLDKLKKMATRDKFSETLYYEKENEKKRFHYSDINIVIGAGGVLSHCSQKQAAIMLIDGLQTEGITQIWRDRYFVSPHFGKLSMIDEKVAKELLLQECIEKLAIHIRPYRFNEKSFVELKKDGKQIAKVYSGEFFYLDNNNKEDYTIHSYRSELYKDVVESAFTSSLPIIIDMRLDSSYEQVLESMSLFSDLKMNNIEMKPNRIDDLTKITSLRRELPYRGEILVEENDVVKPDTIVGENKFYPPKIFVITLFDKPFLKLNQENIHERLKVKVGENVELGQVVVESDRRFIDELVGNYVRFDSPVRGRIVDINFESGVILMREIQDYSLKPIKINVARALGVNPKVLKSYMKKKVGDFVYKTEILAMRVFAKSQKNTSKEGLGELELGNTTGLTNDKHPIVVHVPSTGTIKEISSEGVVTIQYDKEPFHLYAGVAGKISHQDGEEEVVIDFEGNAVYGKIGFGRDNFGKLVVCNSLTDFRNSYENDIVVYEGELNEEVYREAQHRKIGGLVVGSVRNSYITKVINSEIGVALTGNEKIPFPIVVMEGFGSYNIRKEIVGVLKENEGKQVFVSGRTQIRAGVIRPMIVLSES